MHGKVTEKISHLWQTGKKFFFLIDFDAQNFNVYTPEEAFEQGIYFSFGDASNHQLLENKHANKGDFSFNFYPISYDQYHESFTKVQYALHRGDTYLLNLTFKTKVETDLNLSEIYHLSKAKYKLLYKDEFVVFSPERFISISNGVIETRPMKGTIDATIPDAENKLLTNEKELYEHNTIVDLLRNDLNIVSNNVRVENFRYIDHLKTNRGDILQVSSIIKGEIEGKYLKDPGNLILALLPAGSVTGAPKKRTIEIIKNIEDYNRGYYTGVFGYYNGVCLDVAVAIRFIEKEGDNLYYKSGGGITALSDPADEYNEMIKKIYVPIF